MRVRTGELSAESPRQSRELRSQPQADMEQAGDVVCAEEENMRTLERLRAMLAKWGAQDKAEPVAAEAPKQTPERDIRRLTPADFTGACRGEVGGSGKESSADARLERYRRLRDK